MTGCGAQSSRTLQTARPLLPGYPSSSPRCLFMCLFTCRLVFQSRTMASPAREGSCMQVHCCWAGLPQPFSPPPFPRAAADPRGGVLPGLLWPPDAQHPRGEEDGAQHRRGGGGGRGVACQEFGRNLGQHACCMHTRVMYFSVPPPALQGCWTGSTRPRSWVRPARCGELGTTERAR